MDMIKKKNFYIATTTVIIYLFYIGEIFMYSSNKIKPCKLYRSHLANLREFSIGKDFDNYVKRSEFLTEIESILKKLECKYFMEFSEHDNGTIAIYVNNLPID